MSDPTPATRTLIIARDLGRCSWCGRYYGDALNLHHRLLRSHGTDNSPSNLIALCGSGTTGCHGGVHAKVALARERGHIVPSWGTPALVPVLTWRGLLLLDDDGGARDAQRPPASI
ncbi:HNH endonuclease [Microbacterium phage Nicole72]|uniref:HNH endonuclease n=1 Tax=Microbacterium phage Nicole72 TaxID=3062838 RepID=A0ACD4UHN8_9CAUD|nr:HNH endonuclease [Microbacterium phage Nicole72]